MALGDTFDLGRIFQTAEAIKGMRRQESEDVLRRKYLETNISNARQSGVIAGNQEQRAQEDQKAQVDARTAKTRYLEADAILRSADPHAAVRDFAPELVAGFEQQHGAGSFAQLPVEQVKQIAAHARDKAAALAGIQPKVKFIDSGGQQIAIDENTGQPISGVAPIVKTASPDSQLSAQTALRGQDLSAQTAAANRAVTMRGQDMTAETAKNQVPIKQAKSVQQLRKEFRGLQSVKDYETVLPLVETAKKAPDNGYGDLQLIYTVGKVLDPGSVVREGELALTVASGSPLQRIIGTTRFTAEKGGRLTPKARQQLMGMLQERISGQQQAYTRDYDQYAEYAKESGVEPTSVVGSRPESAYGGQTGAPQSIKSDAEYNSLPSGTEFIAPDGSHRRKP